MLGQTVSTPCLSRTLCKLWMLPLRPCRVDLTLRSLPKFFMQRQCVVTGRVSSTSRWVRRKEQTTLTRKPAIPLQRSCGPNILMHGHSTFLPFPVMWTHQTSSISTSPLMTSKPLHTICKVLLVQATPMLQAFSTGSLALANAVPSCVQFFADFTSWLANDFPPRAAYRALMTGRKRVLRRVTLF